MHNRTANVQLITTKKHKGYKNIYFNNIILKTRHLLLLIALISVSKYALCSENKNIEKENTFKNIVHNYILPDENQIFGNKKTFNFYIWWI